jgi:uncharacterized protein
MSGPSPNSVDPWRFADAGTAVRGEIAVSGMSRLASLLRNDSGGVTYELFFALDEQNLPVITGRVAAVFEVVCQRCLEPMPLEVASEVRVAIAGSAAAASSVAFDTVIVEDKRLSLAALVEDELILALPTAPLHAPGECRPPDYAGAVEPAFGKDANRPFAGLSTLKSGAGRGRS